MSGRIDYKITMYPQCILWISAPLPPVCVPFSSRLPFAYPVLVHHWLYDEPGILHRDLSFNNIMHRLIEWKNAQGEREQKVYGVLTDYDLSSWTESMNPDYTKTSQQRTGTPPYMAQELLQGTSPLHLYRHDVESLFHIMLLMSARHTIGTPEGEEKPRVLMRGSTGLPYQKWFREWNYGSLGSFKESFFSNMQAIELSPVFEDFRPWLRYLQHRFSKGFSLKAFRLGPSPSNEESSPWADESATVEFNNKTLEGYIEYSTILAPLRFVTGQLKELIIRDPKNPLVPAQSSSAGAAQVSD